MCSTARLELVATYKNETSMNLVILNKVLPMNTATETAILKENGLEKLTQNLFYHLSNYLVSIIDSKLQATFTWPLHDSKAERAYRNELASFISDYGSKGLLSPVMSSYLVNPSCYKVTVLVYQLSHLAVKSLLKSKVKDKKKGLFEATTEKFTSCSPREFIEHAKSLDYDEVVLNKLDDHLRRKDSYTRMAELVKNKIVECENKISVAQVFIDKLVDGIISRNEMSGELKNEILKVKDVKESSLLFDEWLSETDNMLNNVENNWDSKVVSFLEKCQNMQSLTEAIVLRYTGQIENSAYTIEYDTQNDKISTNDLENQVGCKEKFYLRNLYDGGRLNFPNLIRSFYISISYILKNHVIGDEIYNFVEYLEGCDGNFNEALVTLKEVNERVINASAMLEPAPFVNINQSIKENSDIPPLPNLSILKTNRDQYQIIFDAFTPLNLHRHQFNLRKRMSGAFTKPQTRTFFNYVPKEDFLKNLTMSRVPTHDYTITSQNMSMISNIRANETISECSSGFTRQQITRLLSTKKSSSSKKYKYKQDRPDIKIKKGGLFNESVVSNESNGLFRSYSSPNLFENRETRSYSKPKGRKLSIMPEDNSMECDVSGIACFNSNLNTPEGLGNAESSRNSNVSNAPAINENLISNFDNELKINITPILKSPLVVITPARDQEMHTSKIETPKNIAPTRKSSSLEKIIHRFKKVRANVVQKDDENDIATILEEKENLNVNGDKYATHRNLLPDLLSPSCAVPYHNINDIEMDHLEVEEVNIRRRPRESLGTMLGVDHTFLDQFDLID